MSAFSAAEHRRAYAAGRVLRVVNWHNTPAADEAKLRWELSQYARRFTPATLADVDALFTTGRWEHERPGFLPVFYDGYRNGHDVAARVCGELGLRAVFFPPTAFLSTPVADQRAFALAHSIDLVPDEDGADRLAMTWDELADVATHHDVCGHTASHARAADVTTPQDVHREVEEPLRLLRERCGVAPAGWAWLGGTPFDGGTAAGRALLEAGVRYAFSNTMVERIQ